MTESDLDELEMLHASLPGMNLPPDALHGLLTALVMAGDTVPVEAHVANLLGWIPPDPSVSSASSPSSPSSAAPCPAPDEALSRRFAHLLALMRADVEAVWIQIAAHQADTAMQAMQRGEEAQAWRNNPPCPCGSGKGFLDCCGSGRVLH